MWDLMLIDAHAATFAGVAPYGAVEDVALAVAGDRIAWIGRRADLPGPPETLARRVRRLDGGWITPGLIDCHTHLVFAGDRAGEWEARLGGASYEDVARAGGGIVSTVRDTRAASLETLTVSAAARVDRMAAQGVTTVEVKSGYGLDLDGELKMLRVARRLADQGRVRVAPTLLAAHTVPPEYRDRRADYVALICESIIPAVAAEGLAEAVDAFCETIGFTPAETEQVFAAAARAGLRVKLHAEQLSDQGGAALAARFGALSADHLEHLSTAGVAALAAAGTTAVLLPGAFYFLRDTRLPPIEDLRAAGAPMAVASDCNPGTSPLLAPLTVLNMACTLYRLTPEEALRGMTAAAAGALGRADAVGTLEVGKLADLAVWRVGRPAELCYWIGADLLVDRCVGGRWDQFA